MDSEPRLDWKVDGKDLFCGGEPIVHRAAHLAGGPWGGLRQQLVGWSGSSGWETSGAE